MKIVDLTEEQAEAIEDRLAEYDEKHIGYKTEGRIRIGIEKDGGIVAGLDACMTAYRILYVSTVFVDEAQRRKGYGRELMAETEARAKELGADTVRVDTFDWQGKEFHEALGYRTVGSYENTEDGYSEYFFLKRI